LPLGPGKILINPEYIDVDRLPAVLKTLWGHLRYTAPSLGAAFLSTPRSSAQLY